ncbi:BrnT family toxin [Paracoccus marcusii]|uniref:BrnT family toxin n=1 Tax=Paracoccus marcusii TaxID=59779 RepID=UPI0035A68686
MSDFEWDNKKRSQALEKHGIDFCDAAEIFASVHLKIGANSETELRSIAIGELNGVHIAVVFTERENAIRLITARRARRDEREAYIKHVAGRN